ncbi:MAG: glycosyltransferase family 2 protein [Phycisphaerae bacterium]
MSVTLTHPRTTGFDTTVLSVIAPCFNEQDNVDVLVDRTLAVFDEMDVAAELLLVDDGSTDDTWERVLRCSRRDNRVHGVKHASNQGIEGAWRSGLEVASGELVCLIDADLQNRPEDIPRLYKTYLRELPDIVQAVRHPVRGVRRCRNFSRGLNFLLNLTFRMRLRDSKSGFLLCRRDVLANLLRHRFHYRYFQSFIGVAAGSQGYTIAEVDTDFDQRHAGKSFLSRFPIAVSLRICWELLKFRVETRAATREAATRQRKWLIPPVLAETAPRWTENPFSVLSDVPRKDTRHSASK